MSGKTDEPSKMLRLDSVLWAQISAAAERSGRTTRQEVESRLRDSLHGMPAGKLSPAEALSRLVELHAGDATAYCQTAEEWQADMKLSVPALVNELFGHVKESSGESADSLAVMSARTLAKKVRCAHLPAPKTGDAIADQWAREAQRALEQELPSLGHPQHELLKLQKALFLLPEGVEVSSRSAKRERLRKEHK